MKNIEKVYIDEQIETFFNELIKRKRFDPMEEGLQACGVITPNKAAFKVTEEDGKEPHMYAEVNLINYNITGECDDTIDRSHFNYFNYARGLGEKIRNYLKLRITDSDRLVLAFTCYDIINTYQLKIIKKFVELAKKALKNKDYEEIEIGVSAKNINISFDSPLDSIDRQLFVASRKSK